MANRPATAKPRGLAHFALFFGAECACPLRQGGFETASRNHGGFRSKTCNRRLSLHCHLLVQAGPWRVVGQSDLKLQRVPGAEALRCPRTRGIWGVEDSAPGTQFQIDSLPIDRVHGTAGVPIWQPLEAASNC